MKSINTRASLLFKAAFFFLLVFSTTTFLQAQTTTFGQFIQRNGTQDFIFTNSVTSASFQTIPNGTPVFFTFQNVGNLPAELQGPQFATVTITATTTVQAIQNPGTPPRDVQPFDQTFTIRVIRDTAATSGTGTRRNLLTAVVTPDGTSRASIAGDDLSDAAAFSASSLQQNVVYTSDFLGFLPTGNRNFSLSFSSLIPALSIGPGGFLNSFTAAGTGTFASNPAPVFNPPTASNVSIGGRVLTADGNFVSRANVTLTDSDGNSRSVRTSSLGFFNFSDVVAGQTVTVTVNAKGLRYAGQIIDVQDSVSDLTFYPVEE